MIDGPPKTRKRTAENLPKCYKLLKNVLIDEIMNLYMIR